MSRQLEGLRVLFQNEGVCIFTFQEMARRQSEGGKFGVWCEGGMRGLMKRVRGKKGRRGGG